jgi:Acetamidase/Formamidase family
MPSPQTVHIGYFLASIKPVLSIESGDIVTLESVAAIVPSVVDQAGVVPPGAVPQYHRDIYGEVKDRGPGPHVLTGPIEVKGAMPGDVLEVRILDINLALDWGYNRQRAYAGALPEEFTGVWTRIIPLNRETKTAEVAKGVVVPIEVRSSAPWGWRPTRRWAALAAGRPGFTPAISTTRTSSPAPRSRCRCTRPARCSRPGTRMPRRAMARST